jgi:hypothetical protein
MKPRLLLIACLLASPLAARAQSVVDIAKQKANAPKPAHVFTNDDVATASAASSAADSASSTKGGDQGNDPAAASASRTADRNPDLLKMDPAKANAAEAEAARSFVKAKQVQIDAVQAELKDRQEQLRKATDEGDIASLEQVVSNLRFNVDMWTMQRNTAQKLVTTFEQRQKQAQDAKAQAAKSDQK